MRYNEKTGSWPLMKSKRTPSEGTELGHISSGAEERWAGEEKGVESRGVSTEVRSVDS